MKMNINTIQETVPDKLIRLKQVLELLPISKSKFWEGVRTGLYPQPVKLGPRTTAWRLSDINALIDNGVDCDGGDDAR